MAAFIVPESGVLFYCAVVVVATAGPRVIVTVVRGEHHTVDVAERIFTGVTPSTRTREGRSCSVSTELGTYYTQRSTQE